MLFFFLLFFSLTKTKNIALNLFSGLMVSDRTTLPLKSFPTISAVKMKDNGLDKLNTQF